MTKPSEGKVSSAAIHTFFPTGGVGRAGSSLASAAHRLGCGPYSLSRLHSLANGPILPVHQIPELHHFGRIKALLRHLIGFEQEMTADARAHRAERLEEEGSDVFARHTQQQIGVHELALVALLLVLIQFGEGPAHRSTT